MRGSGRGFLVVLLLLAAWFAAAPRARAQSDLGAPDLAVMQQLQTLWGTALGWPANTNPCPAVGTNWTGVTCNKQGRVVIIVAICSQTQINGAIPGDVVSQLTALTSLDLRNCGMTGSIPSEFGTMTQLIRLRLDGNALSGPIPSSLATLPNLAWLGLEGNQLTGSIPDFPNSSNTIIDLAGNFLTSISSDWTSFDRTVEYNCYASLPASCDNQGQGNVCTPNRQDCPGTVTISNVSGDGQWTQAGTGFTNSLSVLVEDLSGNPVEGQTVTFAGPGIVTTSAMTNAYGIASATITASSTVGGNTVTPSIGPTVMTTFGLTAGDMATCSQTFNVTSNADDGSAGTLRQALADVCPGGTVNLSAIGGATITLAAGRLYIATDVTMLGAGATVNGDGATRIFFVQNGNVELENLTLENGLGAGGTSQYGGSGAGMGGAIFENYGNLTLSNVTLSDNQALGGSADSSGNAFGGGFGAGGLGGDLGGTAGTGDGAGGIAQGFGGNGGFGGGGGEATGGSSIGGSIAGGFGGFGGGGGAVLNDTTAAVGEPGYGGGLPTGGSTGVTGSGGSGAGFGGAVFVRNGSLNLANVAFTDNSAVGGTGAQGKGGSLFIFNGANLNEVPNTVSFTGDVAAAAGLPGQGYSGSPYMDNATCPGVDTADVCGVTPANTVTVSVSGNGTVSDLTQLIACPSTNCTALFASGTTLTASPTLGNVFTGWSGACSGTGPCTVSTASGSVEVGASFQPQVPANVAVSSGSGQSTPINAPFAAPLVALVTDASNNPVPYVTVTFTAPAQSGASLTFAGGVNTAETNVLGLATSAAIAANGFSGGYNVTASVSGVNTPASFSLANTDTPTQVVVSGYPSPVYVGVPQTGTVTVEDANNIPVTAYSGTATLTTTDNAATVPGSVTITNGVGTFSLTFNTTGTQSITPVINGLTGVPQTGIVVNSSPNYVVNSTADNTTGSCTALASTTSNTADTSCTLRAAVTEAATTGGANIYFDTAVFSAANNAAQNTIKVTYADLAIPANTAIQGLRAGSGAALTNLVTLDGNTAPFAVFVVNGGVTGASIANLTIQNAGNAYDDGPGAIVNGGTLTVSNVFFHNNFAEVNGGGAIYNSGAAVVTNSTFSGNSTALNGGAIYNSGTATVTNSTFHGNSAVNGGAILAGGGTVTVTDSTFSGNSSPSGDGGAIDVSGGVLTVANSILSNDGSGGECAGSGCPMNGTNGNIVDETGTLANLAALGNYGGPTQTMIPLPGSGAICAGSASSAASAGVATDQRGVALTLNSSNSSAYTGAGGYCPAGSLDAGAVQTDYAIGFNTVSSTVGPPPAGTVPGAAMSPAPVVTLTETGTPFTGGSASVSVTDNASDLGNGSTLTATTSTATPTAGQAAFSNLIFSKSTTSNDTLKATLSLNPSLDPALSLTATSAGFSVGQIGSGVTISCAACNPNPTFGTSLTFIAVVSPGAGSVTPTGSIAFSVDSGSPVAVTSANCPNGSPADSLCATYSTTSLSASATAHTVEAIFTATGNFQSGNNSTQVTVIAAPTTVKTPPTASPINSGQTLGSSTLSGGTVVVTGTSTVVSGTWAFANSLSTVLTATGSQPVTFTPSSSNYAAPSPTSVTVTVNPVSAPVAKISPTSISFGAAIYLGSTITKTVTITNTGNAAMTIGNPLVAIVKGGNSNEFVTVNLCPKSLAAGKSCTMTVTFVAGPYYTAPQTADLMIYDNAAASPQSVSLTATVIDPVASFNPTSLSFGSVKTSSGSSMKSITVTSTGGTELSIAKVAVSGADPGDFSQTDNCAGKSFNPKASCSISVTFKPARKGLRTATLVVTDNALTGSQSIPLSGIGD